MHVMFGKTLDHLPGGGGGGQKVKFGPEMDFFQNISGTARQNF